MEIYIAVNFDNIPAIVEIMVADNDDKESVVTALLKDISESVNMIEALLTSPIDESQDTDEAQEAIMSTIINNFEDEQVFNPDKIPTGEVRTITADMSFDEVLRYERINDVCSHQVDFADNKRFQREQAGFEDPPPAMAQPEFTASGSVRYDFNAILELLGSAPSTERLRERRLARGL